MLSAGTDYYDRCYQQNVPTILLDGKLNDGDYICPWITAPLVGKTLHLKFVGMQGSSFKYIAWKSWYNNGTPVVIPDYCDLAPASRPLFPSVDYPGQNQIATYSLLFPILPAADEGGYILYFRPFSIINKTYTGKKQIYRFARVCSNADGSEPSYDFNTI